LTGADDKKKSLILHLPYFLRRFLPVFLLSCGIYGYPQENRGSILVSLPDTNLSLERSLLHLEAKTDLYFSYNPEILDLEDELTWLQGAYALKDILQEIVERQDVNYTIIGNMVVFYLPGEEPGLVIPVEERDPGQIRKITGQILSGMDQTPLEFATIWIPATWEGTISNSNGRFGINLPGPDPPDTIAVSCMGYSNRKIAVSDLHDSLNHIFLNPAIIPIQEVVIRRTEPIHLIRQALDKIEDNYARDPVIETAFYRESIQKNTSYVMVSEAVIEIFKPGGTLVSNEQVRLMKGRKNLDINKIDTVLVKLKGGLQTSFMLDFIRYRPDFLDPELFHLFTYKLADIVTVQDRSTYAIDFKQKSHTDPPHYQGRIFIDMETLAFRGVEMEVNPQTISSATNAMVVRKPRSMKVRPLSASYQVSYKSEGDKFYLSMIRADVRFRIRKRKKIFSNEYRTLTEMAVTNLQTEQVGRFRSRETTDSGDIFADLLGGYLAEFWGPFNIITPDESMDDALKRISRLMEMVKED
jgi:hypothetical protein